MRNLSDVIDQMLEVIPLKKKRLIYSLKNIKDSQNFCAPEMRQEWWVRCWEILNSEVFMGRELDQLNKEWHIRVCEIFSTNKRSPKENVEPTLIE